MLQLVIPAERESRIFWLGWITTFPGITGWVGLLFQFGLPLPPFFDE
jgi:hypothetical protein